MIYRDWAGRQPDLGVVRGWGLLAVLLAVRAALPAARATLTRESCERVRSSRRSRVCCCFADVTRQIHSLRASGVMSIQVARASASSAKVSSRSAGIVSCTVPAGSDKPVVFIPRIVRTRGAGPLAFRDRRPFRVSEPRGRAEREHATLSLGLAAAELDERGSHVASEHDRALAGVDDDHLVPV